MSDKKKYDSTVSFQGKKLADIKFKVETIFTDSFLWIKVDHHNQDFIVYLDNKSDPDDISRFEAEFKQCKIRIWKEISLAELRNPSPQMASRR